MTRRKLFPLIAAAVAGLVLALGAVAVLSAPDTQMPWSVFGAGGGSSSSTGFKSGFTAGQGPIGKSGSTNFGAELGFWYGAADTPTATPTATPTVTPMGTPTATPTRGPAVGGIAEPPDLPGDSAGEAGARPGPSGSSAARYAALAGGLAAVALFIAAGGWYARRRWRAG